MKVWIRKIAIVFSLSTILVCGSFTRYVRAASISTRELCEAWASHAATPWRVMELYDILISVYNCDLVGLAYAVLNYGISPRTKQFIEQACALDPDNEHGDEHGGHGGHWGHGGHGGYWGDVVDSSGDDNNNGNNYNYYDSDDHDDYTNYNIIDPSTNSISYTYNNNNYNYNYDLSQTYYNTTNNSYTFNLTNNTQLTYINNYNNTTIIYGGDTTALYYRLPDGSDSYNLTEEEALNGYKTSLSVDSYQNGYDSNTLAFLYHFDNNEYNSAYPVNNSIGFSKNSINYVAGSTGFSYALSFEGDTIISTDTSGLYYSFRFYPLVNDRFSLSINGSDIFARESVITTTYDYVEWTQTTSGESSTDHPIGSSSFTITIINTNSNNTSNGFPTVTGYTRETSVSDLGNGQYQHNAVYRRNAYTDDTDISYTTTQRTYNIINNKLWSDTGSDLVNYGMWNYVAIMLDGSVYINGVDSHIDIDNTLDLSLEFEGDSVFYFDEFFGSTVNRSSYSPSMPYDSNVIYSLPSEFKNNCLLIKSLLSVASWKFGGYRPSNPANGDVFVAVDQLGNITSIQQFNGIEWVDVGAGLYNEFLGIWINAIGFNIFKMNWYYQDLNFDTDSGSSNTLIKFLTEKFNAVITAIKNIKINNSTTNEGDDIANNIQNDYNVNVENDLTVYIDDLIDADSDIDLTAPELNLPQGHDLTLFAPILTETVNVFSSNNLMFVLIVPLAIGILGLIL